MTAPIPIDRIVDMLAARIRELVRTLLPYGRQRGPEWFVGSPAGEPGASLAVHTASDAKAGVWKDFASGEAGDALDLVAAVLFHGNKGEAFKWAKSWLGLDGADPERLKQTRRAVAQRDAAELDDDEESRKKRDAAQRIWLSAEPKLIGTPVDRYLAGRGLDLRRLDFLPGAIRFHPGLYDRITGRKWWAMVTAIVGTDGKFVAVHRTFLAARADGSVVKAPIFQDGKSQAKRVLGSYRGGLISLSKGVVVDPKTGELKKNKRLSVAAPGQWVDETEGIEDGLTVMLAFPERRVIAGVSVSNMAAIVLPESVSGTRLWQQNDDPASPAAASFRKVVRARLARGLTVRLVPPPPEVKDANDWVKPPPAAPEAVA